MTWTSGTTSAGAAAPFSLLWNLPGISAIGSSGNTGSFGACSNPTSPLGLTPQSLLTGGTASTVTCASSTSVTGSDSNGVSYTRNGTVMLEASTPTLPQRHDGWYWSGGHVHGHSPPVMKRFWSSPATHATRSIDEANKSRYSEAGDTLVEVLLAIVILGLASVAILLAFGTSISGSAEHRNFGNRGHGPSYRG